MSVYTRFVAVRASRADAVWLLPTTDRAQGIPEHRSHRSHRPVTLPALYSFTAVVEAIMSCA